MAIKVGTKTSQGTVKSTRNGVATSYKAAPAPKSKAPTPTVDNKKTNSLVKKGVLPKSQAEIYAQGSTPKISTNKQASIANGGNSVGYDSALKNLNSGGLSGSNLAAAQQSLAKSYGVSSVPTPPSSTNTNPTPAVITGDDYQSKLDGLRSFQTDMLAKQQVAKAEADAYNAKKEQETIRADEKAQKDADRAAKNAGQAETPVDKAIREQNDKINKDASTMYGKEYNSLDKKVQKQIEQLDNVYNDIRHGRQAVPNTEAQNSILESTQALQTAQLGIIERNNQIRQDQQSVSSARMGFNNFAPQVAQGAMAAVMEDGYRQVSESNATAALALGELQNSFDNQNLDALMSSWKTLYTATTAKQDAIVSTYEKAKEIRDEYIKFEKEKKTERANGLAANLITEGVNPSTIPEEQFMRMLDEYDIQPYEFYSAYAAAQADNLKGGYSLSEGESRYDSTGRLLSSKAKTYAPEEGDATIVNVGGTSPFVAQSNYASLTAKQKTQADSLNNLVWALDEYYLAYDAAVNADGSELFGQTSAVLETKLNSIIFAAAQAEGTGALQKADREVIERIIPNPTNLGGAFNAWTKGGKQGGLSKIKDQQQKYTNNLSGYGLKPVNPISGDVAPVPNNVDPEVARMIKALESQQQ